MKEFEKFENNIFIRNYYINGDINRFLEKLKTMNVNCYCSTIKDKEYLEFLGAIIKKFELIVQVLGTNKIDKNRNDLKELGKYIQQLGQEIMNHDFTNKNKTKKYSDKTNNKDFEKELTKELEKALNELFGSLLNDISGEE